MSPYDNSICEIVNVVTIIFENIVENNVFLQQNCHYYQYIEVYHNWSISLLENSIGWIKWEVFYYWGDLGHFIF